MSNLKPKPYDQISTDHHIGRTTLQIYGRASRRIVSTRRISRTGTSSRIYRQDWDFDEFYYVEHFATNPALRNGGYGKRTLEHLCEFLKRPIVLEVERPVEEMAKRRINFYQRHGFTLWEKDYYQPPYKEGDDFLPMYLMVHGNLDAEKDYEGIRHKLHTIVYGVKE